MSEMGRRMQECPRESESLRAETSETLAHLQSCERCQQAVLVARYLQTLSQSSVASPSLPNASYLWWRTRMDEQTRATKIVLWPLFVAQTLTWLLPSLALAGLLLWLLPKWQLSPGVTSHAAAIGLIVGLWGLAFIVIYALRRIMSWD